MVKMSLRNSPMSICLVNLQRKSYGSPAKVSCKSHKFRKTLQIMLNLRNMWRLAFDYADLIFFYLCTDLYSHIFSEKWMPICHPETNPILKLLVILVHLEIAGFALIPFATTFYFITSPENGVHPRQVFLPACVKNDPVFVSASLLGVTIIAGMTWYLVMLCVVIATLYFCNKYTTFSKNVTPYWLVTKMVNF